MRLWASTEAMPGSGRSRPSRSQMARSPSGRAASSPSAAIGPRVTYRQAKTSNQGREATWRTRLCRLMTSIPANGRRRTWAGESERSSSGRKNDMPPAALARSTACSMGMIPNSSSSETLSARIWPPRTRASAPISTRQPAWYPSQPSARDWRVSWSVMITKSSPARAAAAATSGTEPRPSL